MKRVLTHDNPNMDGDPKTIIADRILILESLPHPSPRLPNHYIIKCILFPSQEEVYIWRWSLDKNLTICNIDPRKKKERIQENRLSPFKSSRVVSAPGAAIKVTEYQLTDSAKKALTVPSGAFDPPKKKKYNLPVIFCVAGIVLCFFMMFLFALLSTMSKM